MRQPRPKFSERADQSCIFGARKVVLPGTSVPGHAILIYMQGPPMVAAVIASQGRGFGAHARQPPARRAPACRQGIWRPACRVRPPAVPDNALDLAAPQAHVGEFAVVKLLEDSDIPPQPQLGGQLACQHHCAAGEDAGAIRGTTGAGICYLR